MRRIEILDEIEAQVKHRDDRQERTFEDTRLLFLRGD